MGSVSSEKIHGGSYMSARVFTELLNSWGKEVEFEACRKCYRYFATRLMNSKIQEHEC